MKINSAILCFLILFLTQACFDPNDFEDLQSPNYNASFAVPLVNSTISLKELLEEYEEVSTLEIDDEGLIHFIYEGNLIRRTGTEIFEQIRGDIPNIFPVIAPELSLSVSSFLEDVLLERLDLKSGQFLYYLENPHPEPRLTPRLNA